MRVGKHKWRFFCAISCIYHKNVVPLQRETQRRDVCASAEGFADILKRRLLRSVLTFWNVATFNRYSGLSNDRCPTGYRLSLLCLFWYVFCVYTYAHTRTLTIVAREYILYSAWASRCCSKLIGNAKAS